MGTGQERAPGKIDNVGHIQTNKISDSAVNSIQKGRTSEENKMKNPILKINVKEGTSKLLNVTLREEGEQQQLTVIYLWTTYSHYKIVTAPSLLSQQ